MTQGEGKDPFERVALSLVFVFKTNGLCICPCLFGISWSVANSHFDAVWDDIDVIYFQKGMTKSFLMVGVLTRLMPRIPKLF